MRELCGSLLPIACSEARLGTPKAMTAAAHKLARIVYHMITTRQEYDTTVFQELERRVQDRKRIKLRAQARALGFELVPREAVPYYCARLEAARYIWA
jgi:hypothetical protein